MDWPLTDAARLRAACALDGLGVIALRAAGAFEPGAPRPELTLSVWLRAAPDAPSRPVPYGTLSEMRAALARHGALRDPRIAALEVELAFPPARPT